MDSATWSRRGASAWNAAGVGHPRAVLAAYRLPADWSNIDAAVAQVGPLVTQNVCGGIVGIDLHGRLPGSGLPGAAPTTSQTGARAARSGPHSCRVAHRWLIGWPTRVPASNGSSATAELDAAVEVSQARAGAGIGVGSAAQQARSTTWNRMITDSLIAQQPGRAAGDSYGRGPMRWSSTNLWDGTSSGLPGNVGTLAAGALTWCLLVLPDAGVAYELHVGRCGDVRRWQ